MVLALLLAWAAATLMFALMSEDAPGANKIALYVSWAAFTAALIFAVIAGMV